MQENYTEYPLVQNRALLETVVVHLQVKKECEKHAKVPS